MKHSKYPQIVADLRGTNERAPPDLRSSRLQRKFQGNCKKSLSFCSAIAPKYNFNPYQHQILDPQRLNSSKFFSLVVENREQMFDKFAYVCIWRISLQQNCTKLRMKQTPTNAKSTTNITFVHFDIAVSICIYIYPF